MSRRDIVTARLHDALEHVEGVCSVTVVGSFADGEDVSSIGDIDTVVVFDRLTPFRFEAAFAAVESLGGESLGLPGLRVRVNTTFGPVKYGAPGEIVVHLMLYDRASHREHVLRSPFTCFDWERSPLCRGQRLADVYPVGRLAPADFLTARRGLADYIADLESGSVTVRRVEAQGNAMVETVDRVTLDRRRQGQFAYHIVRHLVVNLLKLRSGCNQSWDDAALRRDWRDLSDLAEWLPFYECLRAVKVARGDDFPPDTLARTRAFVDAFEASLTRMLDRAGRLRLVRHASTALNDGTFLGHRDPPLASRASVQPLTESFDRVFASPLRRARETAAALAPDASIAVDARLAEIDYGRAEGLTLAELTREHPGIVAAWEQGEDAAFPGGEATKDVRQRARAFLASLDGTSGRTLAVTHNVVMRVIAADMSGLDIRRAHRIRIGHLQALDICRIGNRWLPDWDTTVKSRIIDEYVGGTFDD